MRYVFFIITSLLILSTIVSKGERRLIPVIVVLLCYDTIIGYTSIIPMYQNGRLSVLFTLCLVVLFQWKKYSQEWKSFPAKFGVVFMLVVSIIIGFHSGCVDTFLHKITIPLQHVVQNYIILFLVYVFCEYKTLSFLKGTVLLCTFMLFSIAIINLILGSNPYISILQDAFSNNDLDFAFKFSGMERFRVNSMFRIPFDFGFVCLIVNLYSILSFYEKQIEKVPFVLLFSMTIIGVFICNTRTVLLSYVTSVFIFLVLTLNNSKSKRSLLILFILSLVSYYTIGEVGSRVDQIFDTVKGSEELEGSSMALREQQLIGSLWYFIEEPVLGHGYRYISVALGQANGIAVDKDMAGYESVVYQLLIERGLAGIVAYLLLYLSIFFYFFKNLKNCNIYASFGISVLVAYLIFAVATGELLSVPISMTFMGIAMKNIELSKTKPWMSLS